MCDVENGIQVGDVERHLRCDVSPGLGSGVSVEQVQTGHINCVACKNKKVRVKCSLSYKHFEKRQ